MTLLDSFLEPLPCEGSAGRKPDKNPDAVWPLPLERTVSYGGGAGRAPAAIVRAGAELERYDEETNTVIDWNVVVLNPLEDDGRPFEQLLENIEQTALKHYRQYPFVMALGGEHTVTIPLLRAAIGVFGPLGVLHVDAHADLRSRYLGQSFSHACVMHHVRALATQSVSVGIRGLSSGEAERIRAERIPVFRAHDIARAADDSWMDRAVDELPEKVYVTVDVDGFDPSVFPGTGTPEPGGLSWRQGVNLLQKVFQRRCVVAADIVEAVPLPGTPVVEYTAARLALKMLVHKRLP